MGELKAEEEAAAYRVADELRRKMLKCVFFSYCIHQTLNNFVGSHGRIGCESDGTTSD
jgi:hypothetical protein